MCTGAGFYAVTYGVLAAVYAAALLARSVWGPLQLIGATAGALIAFVFPALLILRVERLPQVIGAHACMWQALRSASHMLGQAAVLSHAALTLRRCSPDAKTWSEPPDQQQKRFACRASMRTWRPSCVSRRILRLGCAHCDKPGHGC